LANCKRPVHSIGLVNKGCRKGQLHCPTSQDEPPSIRSRFLPSDGEAAAGTRNSF